MAKALNVSLQVSADTGQAKQALQSLQQQLTQLTTTTANITIGGDIKQGALEASKAIAQLQTSLKNSTNSLTGNLNLTKFNQEMVQSGMSLQKYQTQLQAMGPAGQKAFAQLASSIAQAEVPLRRTSGLFSELWTTMKNTARWQISSSILHSFMGAIQGAYQYAQDLNKSLTDIQIVTQASDEHMAQFAKTANTAAKQLSTTTNSYAKASLIYYQQGLGDKEVKERTDATVKMANVTGQTAQQVSDQMTAIWNNFDNGSHSLEYYADVITALGAATASSSEEISRGLEKFAAIADTVGLSYENATAALATITATTRQSADTVGTGLRTLFSRLQSLKLGETLEDGVDLTKYSKALKTIGVDVLDATGNLRDMDDILEDMGAQWDKLNNAQKTAVAQTVGGVRQYTTLMALMENFDFYKQNQQIAESSEGTLQKQQAIYEKSWQAASKRVRASAESIYSDLLDDKFFIKLTNGFGKFLDLIHNTISGLGGLKGVLLAIGTLMTTVFADKTAQRLQNMVYDLKMLTPKGRAEVQGLQQQGAQMLVNSVYSGKDQYSQTMSTAYSQQGALQAAYLNNAEKMSAAQQQVAQSLMQQQAALIQNVDLQAQAVEKAQQEADLQERTSKSALRDLYNTSDLNTIAKNSIYGDIRARIDRASEISTYQGQADSFINQLNALKNAEQGFDLSRIKQQIQDFPGLMEGFQATSLEAGNKFKIFIDAVNSGDINIAKSAFNDLWDAFKAPMGESSLNNLKSTIHALAEELGGEDTEAVKRFEQQLEKLFSGKYKQGTLDFGLKEQTAGLISYTDKLKQAMNELANKPITAMDGLVAMAGTLGSIGMMINQINGLIDVWNNKDLSFGKKLTTTLTTLGMIIPMFTRAFGPESLAKIATFGNLLNGNSIKDTALSTISSSTKTINNANEIAANKMAAQSAREKALATLLASNASKESAAAALLNAGATNEEAIAAFMAAGATEEEARQAVIGAQVNLALGGSAKTAGASFSTMAAGIWSAVWPLLIIAGLIGIGIGIAEAFKTPAEQLEELHKQTEQMKEQADNAKEAYDNLISMKSQHNDLLDNLKDLTAGTLEFQEALLNANKLAEELIVKYKLGSDAYYMDSQGAIRFNEDKFMEAQGKYLTEAQNTQNKFLMSQATESFANYEESARFLDYITSTTIDGLGWQDNVAKAASILNISEDAVKEGVKNGTLSGKDIMTTTGVASKTSLAIQHQMQKKNGSQSLSDVDLLLADALATDTGMWKDIKDQSSIFKLSDGTYLDLNNVTGLGHAGLFGRTKYGSGTASSQTLGNLEIAYAEAFGESALIDLKASNTWGNLSGRKAKREYLARALKEYNSEQILEEKLETYKEKLNSTELQQYKNSNKLTGEQIVTLRAGFEQRKMKGELDQDTADLEEQLNDALWQRYQTASKGFISNIQHVYGANTDQSNQIAGYITNLTIPQLEEFNGIYSNAIKAFGENTAKFITDNYFSENGKINKAFLSSLQEFDMSQGRISALAQLRNGKSSFGVYNEKDNTLAYQMAESIRQDVGEKGLFEELYNSADFADGLKQLQKEFKTTGKIGAKSILELANDTEILKDYLDGSQVNAQGLADALEALESGNINNLTGALLEAFSAAGAVENTLQEVYDFIDTFKEERSVEDIGSFYTKRANAVQSGFESGMLLDAPLLQSLDTMFGTGLRQGYQSKVYELTDDNNRTPQQISDEINRAYADEIAAMKSVQQRGNLSGMFEYYEKKGPIENAATQDAMFTYDKKTGQVVTAGGKESAKYYKEHGWDTQEGFIKGLMENYGVPEDMARSMAAEYAVTNGTISKMWRESAATEGLGKFAGALKEGEGIDASQIRAFYDQYGDVLKGLNKEQLQNIFGENFLDNIDNFNGKIESADQLVQMFKNSAEGTKGTVTDLGKDFNFASDNLQDLKDAYKENNGNKDFLNDYFRKDLKTTDVQATYEQQNGGYLPGEMVKAVDFDDATSRLANLGATAEQAHAKLDEMKEAGDISAFSRSVQDANGNMITLNSESAEFKKYCKDNGLEENAAAFDQWTSSIADSEAELAAAQKQTDILAKAFVQSFAGLSEEGVDVKFTGDTTGLDSVKGLIEGLRANDVTFTVKELDGQSQGYIGTINSAAGDHGVSYTITITNPEVLDKLRAAGLIAASGYNNANRMFAGGKHSNGQYEGPAIVGELGPEAWVHDGQVDLVGKHGREMIYVHPDDQIYTAAETREMPGYSVGYNQVQWGKAGGANAGNAKTSKYDPERYHLITRQLKDLQREYDRLDKIKENCYGTNKLEAIQREIDATQELINGQKELIKEAEDYLEIDKKRLKSLLANGEFQVDENGNLLNFEELQEKYRRKAEEDKDEHAQDVWKALQQYEETLDKLHDANTELQDLIYQQSELALEAITTKVELKIDFDERDLKLIEYFTKKIDDNIYDTARVLQLAGAQLTKINDKIDSTRLGIEEIFENITDAQGNKIADMTLEKFLALSEVERDALNINDNFGKQLEEYSDNLLDYLEELEDLKTKGVDELADALDELNGDIERSMGLFDHYSSLLGMLKDITDLQGVKLSAEMKGTLRDISNIMFLNTQNNIDAERNNYERLTVEVADLRAKVAATQDETLKRQWQEQLEAAEDQLNDSENRMLELWQTGLDQAKQMFEDALNDAVETYESSIAGMYETTTELQKAWDQQKANDDFYVKDFEKYYQISKLQRSITRDLDAARKAGTKQSEGLKKLYDDLNKARENGVELSAYDLDIFAKRYEYEKVLADLEDARNAKSIVRLQRDRNGNWGYVYTSNMDEDDLMQKQQAIDDKFYELQKATQERVKSLSDDMMSEITGVGSRLQELYASGASQEVIDKYLEQEQEYLNKYKNGLETALRDAGMTEEEARERYGNAGFDILNEFQETLFSAITGGNEGLDEFFARIGIAVHDADKTMGDAGAQYRSQMDAVNKWFNESGQDLATVIKGFASMIGDESGTNLVNTQAQIQNAKDTFTEILQAANDFENQFMAVYEPIIKRNEQFILQLNAALDALNRKEFVGGTLMPYIGSYIDPSSFDTGGFTGDWGAGGRLAVLHEKENVFNAEDTARLLSASQILRTIDLQTNIFSKGLGNISTPAVNDGLTSDFEQNVVINADFPNAVNHAEIEEAFNNLANKATQYANRKNK